MHYASGYQIGVRVTQNLGEFAAASLEYNFANQPLRFTNLTPTVQSLSLSYMKYFTVRTGRSQLNGVCK
jgi:hypothetical protein